MTATQLALGIVLGFGGLEIVKVVLATIYDNHKRNTMKGDVKEITTGFIDEYPDDMMKARAAEKRGDKARAVAQKPLSKSQERRIAVAIQAQRDYLNGRFDLLSERLRGI